MLQRKRGAPEVAPTLPGGFATVYSLASASGAADGTENLEKLPVHKVLGAVSLHRSAYTVGEAINERYHLGRPNDYIERTGVLIHQFDESGFENHQARPGGLNDDKPWMPCREGIWCHKFADRFSVSLVSETAPYLFHEVNGGLIISPSIADRSLLCSWASDGRGFRAQRSCIPEGVGFNFRDPNQSFEHRDGCIPGCVNLAPTSTDRLIEDHDTVRSGLPAPTWCEEDEPDHWCPWRPESLRSMLEQQIRSEPNDDCMQGNGCRYNELVLNATIWEAMLPATVEAFFYLSDSGKLPTTSAQFAHAMYLRDYGLDATTVPLLEFDPQSVGWAFVEVVNPLLEDELLLTAARDMALSSDAVGSDEGTDFIREEEMDSERYRERYGRELRLGDAGEATGLREALRGLARDLADASQATSTQTAERTHTSGRVLPSVVTATPAAGWGEGDAVVRDLRAALAHEEEREEERGEERHQEEMTWQRLEAHERQVQGKLRQIAELANSAVQATAPELAQSGSPP